MGGDGGALDRVAIMMIIRRPGLDPGPGCLSTVEEEGQPRIKSGATNLADDKWLELFAITPNQ